MSFLDEFDRRKEAQNAGRKPGTPPEGESPENRELLDFADLIRSRQAVPNDAAQQRLLERVRATKASGAAPIKANFGQRWLSIAALIGFTVLIGILTVVLTPKPVGHNIAFIDDTHKDNNKAVQPNERQQLVSTSNRVVGSNRKPNEEFANLEFPKPQVREGDGAGSVETKVGADAARMVRVKGLAMFQQKGETRWRVGARGQPLSPGDVVRASKRLESAVRILGPDGSAVSLASGAAIRYGGPRAWELMEGSAQFEVASRKDLAAFAVTTPHGKATALGTVFTLDAGKEGDAKGSTLCWVDEGKVTVAARNQTSLELDAGKSALVNSDSVVPNSEKHSKEWLAALERIAADDNGVGRLVAKAEKAGDQLPLEIKSHSVSVTVVDQVARTFVDEVFVNNTDRRLEGVFYYPLPPDASISEFAMYVGDQRIVGEVLEQQHARQIFEYIVRQQRDPALLEYAGGNLFKMRVFPIEPKSEKRIQLGYTQILPRSKGKVTYTYPLYSEMLLKNPLHDLKIEFRVISTPGLTSLASPTHDAPSAIDTEGKRGALAFHAKKYSPTRDFTVTYDVPDGAECVAFANLRPDDPQGYFMVQLCPKVELPQRDPPQRMLVVVDGSASSGPQEYAVATEFTASAADVSGNWQFGVLRGGQKPQSFGAMAYANPDTSSSVRDFLQKTQPLGATDLLETFRQAANMLKPNESIQIVYVGDGVDTVSELAGPALVKEIVALFKGKDVKVSTVAIGSSYDRSVLQGIAAKLGGTFTRVEGASDVHSAVGQVFDSFYRPLLWDVMVNFEEIDVAGVHPEFLGTVAAGDTAIVLGRYNSEKLTQGRVKVLADVAGKLLERSYDIRLNGDEQNNRFLPRLWAKAQIDALMEKMGSGAPSEDARTKQSIIETSINYQIMSQFTAFLVLESEEDYARFGIKRKMKMMDWDGDAANLRGESDAGSFSWGATKGKKEAEYMRFKMPLEEAAPLTKSLVAADELSLEEEYESLGEDLKNLNDQKEFDRDRADDSVSTELLDDNESDLRDLRADKPMRREFAKQQAAQSFFAAGELQRKVVSYRSGGGRRANYAGRFQQPQQYSQVFSGKTKLVELQIDQPTRPLVHYQRLTASGKGTLSTQLNMVLALEQAGRNEEALKTLLPLIEKLPASVDLRLQEGVLRYRTKDETGGKDAFATALKLAADKDKREVEVRIATLLSTLGQYKDAAERFTALAKSSENADDAIQQTQNAVNNYHNIGKPEQRLTHWDELLKRWPDNAKALAAAANYESYYGDADRALKLAADARKVDAKVNLNLVGSLFSRNRRAEALAEFQYLVVNSTESNQIYSALSSLWSDNKLATSETVKILNGPSTAAAQSGAAQFLYSYSGIRDRKTFDALIAATNRPDFAGQARIYAFYSIMNGRNQGFATTFEPAKFFAPVLENPKIPEDWSIANQAVSLMTSYGFAKDALEAAQKLEQRKDIPDDHRRIVGTHITNALRSLSRYKEADERALQVISGAKDEYPAFEAASQAVVSHLSQADYKGAAMFADSFAKRFSESQYCLNLFSQLLQHLKRNKRKEDASALIDDLAKKYPTNTTYAEMRARMLASSGKLRDAAEAVRAIIVLLENWIDTAVEQEKQEALMDLGGPNQEEIWRKRAQLLERHRDQRDTLIQLLAQLCAQDAELRTAFIKEADEKAKNEDPVQREWTEAALACLNSAGDVEGALKRMQALAAAEPNDPLWTLRYGQELSSRKKYAEALKILAPISDRNPDDAELALHLSELCKRTKDTAGADRYFARAFDAMVKQPNILQNYAYQWQNNNSEWALKAWTRLSELPAHRGWGSYQVATILQQLGREKEAVEWFLKTMESDESSYASNALQNLISLSSREEHLRVALPKAHEMLAAKPQGVKAIYLNLLVYNLEKTRGANFAPGPGKELPADIARRALDAAVAIELPAHDYNPGYQVIAALVQEAQFDRAENYALEGGGKLNSDARRYLIRQAATGYFNRDGQRDRSIRLMRELLKDGNLNDESDFWQLTSLLIQAGNLQEAEKITRSLPETRNSWVRQNCWSGLIQAYRQKNQLDRAGELAVESWLAQRDDPSYSSSAFSQLTSTLNDSTKKGARLKPETQKLLIDALRDAAKASFNGDQKVYPWNYGDQKLVDNLGLRNEFTAMAREAAASDDFNRVAIAAEYFRNSANQIDEAEKLYRRAITLPGGENSNNLNNLYQILIDQRNNRKARWGDAIDLLEKLKSIKGMHENTYLWERGRCLYGLKRTDEARESFRKLMKAPDYVRNGYWNFQSIANEMMHTNKDYVMAAECWEKAIQVMRRQSPRNIDAASIAQLYESCAAAYAQLGEHEKALDSYLRGMSVVPRTDASYQRILDAALKAVLKGDALEKKVAEYEKMVAASGGSERPHLRIAFAEGYKKANDHRSMLKHLSIAADLLPKDTSLRLQVIEGYKQLKDNEAALAAYREWAKFDPQNIEIYRGMGDLLHSLGRTEDALMAWATMAEVRPREAEGYRAYSQKLVEINKLDGAAVALRHAIRYRPTEFDIAKELSEVYAKLKQTDKIPALWTAGETACRKAMGDFADDPQPWLNLGRFLGAQNRNKDERELYMQIQQRNWPRFNNETKSEVLNRLQQMKH